MKFYFTFFLLFSIESLFGQEIETINYKYFQIEANTIIPISIENNLKNINFLNENNIKIKNQTKNWIFISGTPKWAIENQKKGNISKFHLDNYFGQALTDSSKVLHHVNEVNNGENGLNTSYKGKNVIIGVIDVGLDVTHPDFKDSLGKTRVLRYWDQTFSGTSNITPYNYGRLWDSTAINNGSFTGSTQAADPIGHGTTVTGRAAGNGGSCGQNAGFAPESSIVFVQSNLNRPNWTLSVADACDYIFKYADSIGLPAVINISLGSYIGSHDGNDPASELMEQLVDQKGGRIIVSAAGNAGNFGRIHVRGTATSDTSFVWFLNNPGSNIFGQTNKIYMDIWADTSDADFIDFAFGADKPAPNYGFRGKTKFYNLKTITKNGIILHDTIYNANHQRLAIIDLYPEMIDSACHLEAYFSKIDSTSYYYRLMSLGSGSYDTWGSSNSKIRTNDLISSIPSSLIVPEIVKYQMPDFNQSIVSSFNCSEKIISVGNVKSRTQHTDKNNNTYSNAAGGIAIGQINTTSSKGPNRHNHTKPDVAASGEFGIAPVPAWMYSNATYNSSVDINGFQGRNNGTSMAAPSVSGIAALYLEKCSKSSYNDFKTDLFSTATVDGFTGNVPNNAYGYGKPNALNLMLLNNASASISGNSGICSNPITLGVNSNQAIDSIKWSNSLTNQTISISTPDTIFALAYYGKGCKVLTDTAIIKQNTILPNPIITQNNHTLTSDTQANYQWVLNSTPLTNEINQNILIVPMNGDAYSVFTTSIDGCVSTSNTIIISTVSIDELTTSKLDFFPNPSFNQIFVSTEVEINSITAIDNTGRSILLPKLGGNKYQIENLNSGVYTLKIDTNKGIFNSKLIKM